MTVRKEGRVMVPYAKAVVFFFTLCLLALMLTACGRDRFVGKWVAIDDESSVVEIARANHTYRIVTEDGQGHTATCDGRSLRFIEVIQGVHMPADVTLDEQTDQLTITYMGPISTVYVRKK